MLKISTITHKMPTYMIKNNGAAKKQIKLPSMAHIPNNVKMLSTSTLSMVLPAAAFLNKTNKEPLSLADGYVERGGQWYEIHYPQDGSDYYHETPCENPYAPPKYYPIS